MRNKELVIASIEIDIIPALEQVILTLRKSIEKLVEDS